MEMDFGKFNILCVTLPLIITLCVVFYMHMDTKASIERLAASLSKPEAESTRPEPEKSTREAEPEAVKAEADEETDYMVVRGRPTVSFEQAFLDSVSPILMSTVHVPEQPARDVEVIDTQVRRRGRKKAAETTPAASEPEAAASVQ
jgi:hypothetical protein